MGCSLCKTEKLDEFKDVIFNKINFFKIERKQVIRNEQIYQWDIAWNEWFERLKW